MTCYLRSLASTAFAIVTLISCQSPSTTGKKPSNDSVIATIEWYNDSAANAIARNPQIDIIARGFDWAEGPLWVDATAQLLFSDVPQNKIYSWKAGDSARVYLTPSGFADTAHHVHQDGSNGLALDSRGRLLICQSGDRRVARMKTPIASPTPQFEILADRYEGKRFNSPNDLVADSKNNIYFTDPVYGLPQQDKDPTRELQFEGVYRIDPSGNLKLMIDSIPKPNGVALSADEKTLYVASSDAVRPCWYAYRLNANGDITGGGPLLYALPLRQKAQVKQSPDGLKIDAHGNIFSAGPDGINIISPNGKLLGLIRIRGRSSSNCSFNKEKNVLYVTADDLILQVKF